MGTQRKSQRDLSSGVAGGREVGKGDREACESMCVGASVNAEERGGRCTLRLQLEACDSTGVSGDPRPRGPRPDEGLLCGTSRHTTV